MLVAGSVCAGGGEPAAGLITQADGYWAAGRLDQAQQAFEAAAAAEPGSSAVLLRLAGFQLSRQQTTASVASYQRAVGLEPTNAKAWLGLGLAYLHGGNKALARSAFEEAVRLEPQRKEDLSEVLANLERQ
jgi:Flp pilus assembly protein TadD